MNATTTASTGRWTPRRIAIWTAVSLLGAVAWGVLALVRGESVNAVWLIVAALRVRRPMWSRRGGTTRAS